MKKLWLAMAAGAAVTHLAPSSAQAAAYSFVELRQWLDLDLITFLGRKIGRASERETAIDREVVTFHPFPMEWDADSVQKILILIEQSEARELVFSAQLTIPNSEVSLRMHRALRDTIEHDLGWDTLVRSGERVVVEFNAIGPRVLVKLQGLGESEINEAFRSARDGIDVLIHEGQAALVH